MKTNTKQKRSKHRGAFFNFQTPEPENEAQAFFEVLRLAEQLTKALQTYHKHKAQK